MSDEPSQLQRMPWPLVIFRLGLYTASCCILAFRAATGSCKWSTLCHDDQVGVILDITAIGLGIIVAFMDTTLAQRLNQGKARLPRLKPAVPVSMIVFLFVFFVAWYAQG